MKRAFFWFDGGKRVPGWSAGEYWNGFAVPLFDERQIEAARDALRDAGMHSDFHSGDILEIWPVEEPDLLIEHEALRIDGRLYWQLDGFTWNESLPRRAQSMRASRSSLDIPGWSVGYHREIGSHAAIRTPLNKSDWLFIMTTPEDREPRSLDDEVAVGLTFFDGENWDQVAYEDFQSVADVLRMSDAALWLKIEHGLSVDQARSLLIEEFEEWGDNDGESSITSWMNLILKDAGVSRSGRELVESAVYEAVEQIKNASPIQILEYMIARSAALQE